MATDARKTRAQLKAETNALADKTLAANIMQIIPKQPVKPATKLRKRQMESKQIVPKAAEQQQQQQQENEQPTTTATTTVGMGRRRKQEGQEAASEGSNASTVTADHKPRAESKRSKKKPLPVETVKNIKEQLQQENEQPITATTTVGKVRRRKQAGQEAAGKDSVASTATAEHKPRTESKLSKKKPLPVETVKNSKEQLEQRNEQPPKATTTVGKLRRRKHEALEEDSDASTTTVEHEPRVESKRSKKTPLPVETVKNNKEQLRLASSINNNNSDYIDMEAQEEYHRIVKRKTEELKALNDALAVPPPEAAKVGYTHEHLQQFLLNSSLSNSFPFALQPQSTSMLLRGFIASVYALKAVQLDELLDLYHLCIMMQHYEQLDTHCMGYRCQLLEAVCELAVELQPKDADIIGISLCDRFVLGTGKARMERVIDMHSSIVLLIKNGDEINRRIAMTMLLATFSKVSGQPNPDLQTDVLKQAFEMAQRVNWTKLVSSGCEPDLYLLVRSFSLILNTQENRCLHSDWDKQLGSEIHKYFMTVLRTVRFSRNYNFFAMMVERYIAFCVVRGATARAHTTEMLPDL
ncbi:hypothetical protein KR044_006182 [Drosophila immigrans]|nr:hypothetical protein KR044_006182 [Drosophila immigrans]